MKGATLAALTLSAITAFAAETERLDTAHLPGNHEVLLTGAQISEDRGQNLIATFGEPNGGTNGLFVEFPAHSFTPHETTLIRLIQSCLDWTTPADRHLWHKASVRVVFSVPTNSVDDFSRWYLVSLEGAQMQKHYHTNFTISLPSGFSRLPQKGYSDAFFFKKDQPGGETVFLSFQLVVNTNTPLTEMKDVQLMDVIFRSGADFSRYYSSIAKRQAFQVPMAKSGEIVYYETERELGGYWGDARGRNGRGPTRVTKAIAYVIDTGPQKFVFCVAPQPDDNTLKQIEIGLSAFEPQAEPPAGGNAAPPARKQ